MEEIKTQKTTSDSEVVVDCQVINFLRTSWGYYKGRKTMIAESNYDKKNIELRSFDTQGNIIGSEHFSKKKILEMIDKGEIRIGNC